nr:MAG TPA: hypothetical protein [Bacteriophage sp.]
MHQTQELFSRNFFAFGLTFFQIDYCIAHPSGCILTLSVGKNKPKEFSNDRPQPYKPARVVPGRDLLGMLYSAQANYANAKATASAR